MRESTGFSMIQHARMGSITRSGSRLSAFEGSRTKRQHGSERGWARVWAGFPGSWHFLQICAPCTKAGPSLRETLPKGTFRQRYEQSWVDRVRRYQKVFRPMTA